MRSCFSYFLYVFTCVVIVVFVTNEIKEKKKKKKKKSTVPRTVIPIPYVNIFEAEKYIHFWPAYKGVRTDKINCQQCQFYFSQAT